MSLNNQIFEKPITEVIRARTSIRSYNGEVLDKVTEDKLLTFINEVKGPFGEEVQVKLINSKDSNTKLGTYGVIKGTSTFIAATVAKSDRGLVELGYLLERGVLLATALNLGTCWLGGTFNKGQFAEAMELKANETLPAVIAIGYPSGSRRGVDSFIRFMSGSKNRKPWSQLFFNENFNSPLKESEELEYFTPLEMVRIAPSATNKQPWRVVKTSNSYDFYLERNKTAKSNDTEDNLHEIDMGIAMCHFELAARELGLKGSFENLFLPSVDCNEYIISWKIH